MNTTDDQLAAVSEIGFDQNGRPKLKLHNKQAALESLGKHFGIFEADNRQKVPSADEVKVALEDLTPTEAGAEWARLIADV